MARRRGLLGSYSPVPEFSGQGASTGVTPSGAGAPPPAATGGTLPSITQSMMSPMVAPGRGLMGGFQQGGFQMGAPSGAWGGFANGQIPLSALRNVYGFYVAPQVADNLTALLGGARQAGVWNPGMAYATGTYRPLSVQQSLWQQHLSGQHPAPVARPGTSMHGWGEAIDFNMANQALIRWLAGNAGRYGFADRVGGEPWHYSTSGY